MSIDVRVDRTETLRALGEPARWRIVQQLADEELCVCHLVDELAMPQPLVSHHLRVLRGAGIVESAPLARRALAEYVGTAFLVAVVVGSGIAAERLSPGDVGLQLLENAAATAAGLVALILALGPVSGAHFNPVVSLADAWFGGLDRRDLPAYLGAQIAGGITGAVVANLMFELAPSSGRPRRDRAVGCGSVRSWRPPGCSW